MTTKQWLWTIAVGLLISTGGCIVQDKIMTLTINPDGSAEMTVLRSNIRSTEEGEKGESEIAGYRAAFNGQTDDDLLMIRRAGAQVESAVWLRQQVPLANAVHAIIPSADALEKLLTIPNGDGPPLVISKFTSLQSQRRLSLQVTMQPSQLPPATDPQTAASEMQLKRASEISELRLAVTNGTIIEARGFTVASDKHSALLDVATVMSLVRAGNGNAELFVEWEVSK
jgi:hypothetical protein